ncbi:unnamed protein product [Trichogramma brassicae]|uniref:Uncharacterized protein n=1 Tax=Trichogramma brassicae TaxID=86971 RepID=A0A6H5I268_9HYME|nr:unnamed protein product [Trichogramma brassicae]
MERWLLPLCKRDSFRVLSICTRYYGQRAPEIASVLRAKTVDYYIGELLSRSFAALVVLYVHVQYIHILAVHYVGILARESRSGNTEITDSPKFIRGAHEEEGSRVRRLAAAAEAIAAHKPSSSSVDQTATIAQLKHTGAKTTTTTTLADSTTTTSINTTRMFPYTTFPAVGNRNHGYRTERNRFTPYRAERSLAEENKLIALVVDSSGSFSQHCLCAPPPLRNREGCNRLINPEQFPLGLSEYTSWKLFIVFNSSNIKKYEFLSIVLLNIVNLARCDAIMRRDSRRLCGTREIHRCPSERIHKELSQQRYPRVGEEQRGACI